MARKNPMTKLAWNLIPISSISLALYYLDCPWWTYVLTLLCLTYLNLLLSTVE